MIGFGISGRDWEGFDRAPCGAKFQYVFKMTSSVIARHANVKTIVMRPALGTFITRSVYRSGATNIASELNVD